MKHVIIIDEDRDIQAVLNSILVEADFFSEILGDAAELMTRLNNVIPDLIISDINLEESGVFTRIKARYPELKILALSSRGRIRSDLLFETHLRNGIDAVMLKPFKKQELIEQINGLITAAEKRS